MASERRDVIDTNVLISALLLPESIPQQVLLEATTRGRLLISVELILELKSVLDRPKFDRYITAAERDEFLARLVLEGTLVTVTERVTAARDPKDDHVLSLAVSGAATAIVTGDSGLLALHPFRGIDIISPADYLRQFHEGERDGDDAR